MRSTAVIGGILALLGAGTPARAQDAATTQPTSRPAATQAELEQRFIEQMTDVVFVGSWQVTDAAGLEGRAKLGEARSERYSIRTAVKEKGDHWLIVARMEFAEVDATLPLRLRVVWAGDTPVITLDELPIPGVGTYTARVMIYRNFYCGTWFGSGYGGIMSGQILQRSEFERLFPEAAEEAAED